MSQEHLAGAHAFYRRDLFSHLGTGVTGMALASLLGGSLRANEKPAGHESVPNHNDLVSRPAHFPGKAKAVIQLFMNGGPSQMDLFDPKPTLTKLHGKSGPGRINGDLSSPRQAGKLLGTPFQFAKHGQSGMDISEALPQLHKHADEIAVVRSMYAQHFNHEPALYLIHSGKTQPGLPSLGSWVVYALGSENENLPAYIVLDDPNGLPVNGTQSWQAGYLPGVFQGTRLRARGTPILNLDPPAGVPESVLAAERALLKKLDAKHLRARPLEDDLRARIASYELAARMQLSASDALDLSQESESTKEKYGLNAKDDMASYGRRCLLARRLVERGVRFVQIFIEGQIWDSHSELKKGILRAARKTDQPVSALLNDLRERGLWDDVLVVWNGEFGRLPLAQIPQGASQDRAGRDHGPGAFSLWMAGAGVKGGVTYGETDDLGHRAAVNRVSVHDFHATILHLLGLQHRDVFYTQPSQRRDRLTDEFPVRIVKEILA